MTNILQVFEAVVEWVKRYLDMREEYMADLMVRVAVLTMIQCFTGV